MKEDISKDIRVILPSNLRELTQEEANSGNYESARGPVIFETDEELIYDRGRRTVSGSFNVTTEDLSEGLPDVDVDSLSAFVSGEIVSRYVGMNGSNQYKGLISIQFYRETR